MAALPNMVAALRIIPDRNRPLSTGWRTVKDKPARAAGQNPSCSRAGLTSSLTLMLVRASADRA